MATYDQIADAIIQQEGSMLPGSVNMTMVTRHGFWNVGHLVWAQQRGAVPVRVGTRLWAGWPTYEESRQGLIRQIRLDADRGLTLEEFISKYAPRSENDTSRYIAFVSQQTGIPPDGRLSDYLTGVQYAQVPRSDELSPLGLGVGDGERPDAGGEQLAGGWSATGVLLLAAAAGTIAAIILSRD